MKGRKIKLVNGYECDVMYAKNWYKYLTRPGVSSAIKRGIRRRDRHKMRRELDEED